MPREGGKLNFTHLEQNRSPPQGRSMSVGGDRLQCLLKNSPLVVPLPAVSFRAWVGLRFGFICFADRLCRPTALHSTLVVPRERSGCFALFIWGRAPRPPISPRTPMGTAVASLCSLGGTPPQTPPFVVVVKEENFFGLYAKEGCFCMKIC